VPTHAEKKFLPYTAQELFDLVADIERYPEFLPWCVGTRIRSREDNVVVADMIIGYKAFRERFTSRVTLSPPGEMPGRIDVAYSEGPFKYLTNHWIFVPEPNGTTIDFFVDFEFRSRILQALIGVVFGEAVRIMVNAFERRAEAVYGKRAPFAQS
jgi:coenzyme Q-binding protein COQ10